MANLNSTNPFLSNTNPFLPSHDAFLPVANSSNVVDVVEPLSRSSNPFLDLVGSAPVPVVDSSNEAFIDQAFDRHVQSAQPTTQSAVRFQFPVNEASSANYPPTSAPLHSSGLHNVFGVQSSPHPSVQNHCELSQQPPSGTVGCTEVAKRNLSERSETAELLNTLVNQFSALLGKDKPAGNSVTSVTAKGVETTAVRWHK